MKLEVQPLEPRETPRVWVDVRFPDDEWGRSEWVRSVVYSGVYAAAKDFTNPAEPVVRLDIVFGAAPGTLADGGKVAPGHGRIRLDFRAIYGGGFDPILVFAHEFAHAVYGTPHIWNDPLMHPSVGPDDRWDGTFSDAVKRENAVRGFVYDPLW